MTWTQPEVQTEAQGAQPELSPHQGLSADSHGLPGDARQCPETVSHQGEEAVGIWWVEVGELLSVLSVHTEQPRDRGPLAPSVSGDKPEKHRAVFSKLPSDCSRVSTNE